MRANAGGGGPVPAAMGLWMAAPGIGSHCALIGALLLTVLPVTTAARETGAAPTETAPAQAQEQEQKPAVAEIFTKRQEIQRFLLTLAPPATDTFLQEREDRIAELQDALSEVREAVDAAEEEAAGLSPLLDLQATVRTDLNALDDLADELAARAVQRDRQLDELGGLAAQWKRLGEVADEREAPQTVTQVMQRTAGEMAQAAAALRADRDETLADLARVSELQRTTLAFDEELLRRRQAAEKQLQSAADSPIWSPRIWRGWPPDAESLASTRRAIDNVVDYTAEHWPVLAAWLLAFTIGAYILLRLTGAGVSELLEQEDVTMRAGQVFERPQSVALLIGLIAVYMLAQPAPSSFNSIVLALMPFPAATLAVSVFAKPIRLSVYTLAVVLTLIAVKPVFEAMALESRIALILQSLAMAGALFIDWRRGGIAAAFPNIGPKTLSLLVLALLSVLVANVVADVIGQVGVASTLRSLVLGGLGLGMVFAALTYAVTGLALAVLNLRPLSLLPVVRHRRWTIVRNLRSVVRVLMVAVWAWLTLSVAGLQATLLDYLRAILGSQITLGAITVDTSAIFTGAVVLVATWILNRVVRFLLDGQSLSGVDVAAGLAFAISKVLRYAIAVIGFLLAISAMGFDVTRVTVLAGALGVGIGFGLQNIVNNFFSGLILLFEQPIKINDIAKVDNMIGTVRELGIRSTVIETFDGAELIVPNADLISKTVLNWTKSNRRRRAEIEVGVAYGTDVQRVLDILQGVVADREDVLDDPEPFAIFTGFGESSMNFRLYLWLRDLDAVLRTPSEIRQQILAELEAANISIPFPQRDVRVTVAGDASAIASAHPGRDLLTGATAQAEP